MQRYASDYQEPSIVIEGLAKSFGQLEAVHPLSLSIGHGELFGLIGPDGAGKTTLLRMLTSLLLPTAGGARVEGLDVVRDYRALRLILGYMPGRFSLYQDLTVRENLEFFASVFGTTVREGYSLIRDIYVQIERFEGRRAGKLSGGMKQKLALSCALIHRPRVLFLDEPTNHLDLKSIEWLEGYLARSTMGLLLITHDRYFLDRVCNEILELDGGQAYRYRGNYDYYLAKRQERHEAEDQARERALNLYRRELEWMRRQPQARGTKAQYRIDAFHELEKKTVARQRTEQVDLGGAKGGYIGKKIFEAKHVSKRFGDKVILEDFNYIFARHDKVGIIGENGVGKTTFLRMLLGEVAPDSGTFDIGTTVRFGYYSQTAPDFDPKKRVIDIVQDIADDFVLPQGSNVERISASQILTRFLFPPERQYTPVEKLSGGELRRLYLCTILVTSPNFLILDEPTNDLDILTLQALEEYLSEFAGCVLIVSHDRFFMDKVTEHLFCFEGEGQVRDFPGSYTLYREVREAEERERAEQEQARRKASEPAPTPRTSTSRPARLSYAEKKELEGILSRIPELEREKAELEERLSTGALSHDALIQASERIGQLIDEMDELTLRQLELEEKGN